MPSSAEILALTVAVGFAAGLNVYAVVATLGLLARAELVTLPTSIGLIDDWWVIGACVALYALEFIADKIPVLDLVWNVIQTFVRVPVASLLAFAATDRMSTEFQVVAALAGGAAALAASSGKLALRGAVTTSPEPFTNIVLSVGEDILAIGLTWLATEHPWIAASLALACIVVVIVLARVVLRAMAAVVRGARRQLTGAG
jgi:hypothetical protein